MTGFGFLEIDRTLRNLLTNMGSLDQLKEETTALVGRGSAESALVSAEVDHTGRVTDVTMHQRARRVATSALTAAITEACRAASDDLERRTRELLSTRVPSMPNQQGLLDGVNQIGPDRMTELVKKVTGSPDPAKEATSQLMQLQEDLGAALGRTVSRS